MSPVHVALDVSTNIAMVKSTNPDHYKDIDVAVGIVTNGQGEVLVAKRPDHLLGGGFWEFPGGKIEAGENPELALKRELLEETGIQVKEASPLISFNYKYPERKVTLNAWRVHSFEGMAKGLEGQEISWRNPNSLHELNMLPANKAIVTATLLPDAYLITPNCYQKEKFLERLESLMSLGLRLIQLRSKNLHRDGYLQLAKAVLPLAKQFGARVLLNFDDVEIFSKLDCDGFQLRSNQLLSLHDRPIPPTKWLGASCHNEAELKKAEALGVDFVTISPVRAKKEHQVPLGWEKFKDLVSMANVPVFALGGLGLQDLDYSKQIGAQGIAAISQLWDAENLRQGFHRAGME